MQSKDLQKCLIKSHVPIDILMILNYIYMYTLTLYDKLILVFICANNLIYKYSIRKFHKSMRFTQQYKQSQISQWKSCYLQYEHLKIWLTIIRDTVRERLEIEEIKSFGIISEVKIQTGKSLTRKQIPEEQAGLINGYYQNFVKQGNLANNKFMEVYQENMELFGKFVNWKFKEIQTNFHMCWLFNFMAEDKGSDKQKRKQQYIPYLQYLFVESLYLVRMIQATSEAQRRLLSKHKLYSTNVFPTPQPKSDDLINIDNCHILRRSIQRFFFRVSKKPKQKNRFRLRKLATQFQIRPKQSLTIGILVGVILTVIIFICVILSRASITLQDDPVFNMNFPLFRGIAYIIFYLWAFGVNLLYFQRYKISHRIIFQNNYTEYPHSADLFQIAGVFSILFVVAFTLYALNISGLMHLGGFSPQILPLLVWLIFLAFLFNPIPILFWHGRLYFFKLVLKVLSSIIIFVNFPIIFGTAQSISLLNVFQDLFYSFCYAFTHVNTPFPLNNASQQNICRPPAVQARFIYTVVIYSIRIIQCIKVGLGQGGYWKKSEFLNSIKFSLSLITSILAYLWQSANNDNVFPAWVVFAVVSTLASFFWDLKIGWDLLERKSKNWMLRDDLIYPKRNYYLWIFINFTLRSAWTFNISPNIVRNFFVSPELFAITFAFLEIFRRGVWNLVRVQVEQIRNNQQLRALPKNQQKIQKQLYKFISEHKSKLDPITIEQLVDAGQQIVENEKQDKQKLGKIKQQIKKDIKQLDEKLLEYKKIGENIIQQDQKLVKQLLQNIY